jgi:hypothetical protein
MTCCCVCKFAGIYNTELDGDKLHDKYKVGINKSDTDNNASINEVKEEQLNSEV